METARRAQIMAAAIDTIAEAGFAGASFAHIAGKLGISRGLISYHFAGKDDLVKEVIYQAAEQAKAFIRPRILAEPTSPGMLRAYIESNLAFMRDHRNNVIAMVEIAGSTEGDASFYGDTDVVDAVRALALDRRFLGPGLVDTPADDLDRLVDRLPPPRLGCNRAEAHRP